MAKPKGFIIYEGASQLDGAPIVVVALRSTRNPKTGDMIQTYIIRSDIAPVAAVHSGADVSICGDCPHRGRVVDGRNVGRSCYVTVFHGPRSVFEAYKRGNYPVATADDIAALGADRLVRLGTYGDPAAVPVSVWDTLTSRADTWTGYTHQWRTHDLQRLCMASADSEEDRDAARARGYRTFRIRTGTAPVLSGEAVCPASAEAGHKLQCSQCKACSGTSTARRGDIVIKAHGIGAGNISKRAAA